MINRRLLSLIAFMALVIGNSGASEAVEPGNWYVGLSLDVSKPRQDLNYASTSDAVSYSVSSGVSGYLGFKYDVWRTELQLSQRRNNVSDVSASILTGDSGSTLADTTTFNFIYDFDNKTPFTPYLGAGAGVSRIKHQNVYQVASSTLDSEDYVLAGQGIAGFAYKVNENWDFITDARYLLTSDQSNTTLGGTKVEGKFKDLSFNFGLLYSF